MSDTLKVFYFTNPNLSGDILNDKGNPTVYKDVAIIARTEKQARSLYKWKLPNEEYCFIKSIELSKNWQVPLGFFPNDQQV